MSLAGATITSMRDRWHHHPPAGYSLNPPETCAACGWAWPTDPPGRPAERPIRCTCPTTRRGSHRAWQCPICQAHVAEGCTDTTRWVQGTYPHNLPDDARIGIPPETMRETIHSWPDG